MSDKPSHARRLPRTLTATAALIGVAAAGALAAVMVASPAVVAPASTPEPEPEPFVAPVEPAAVTAERKAAKATILNHLDETAQQLDGFNPGELSNPTVLATARAHVDDSRTLVADLHDAREYQHLAATADMLIAHVADSHDQWKAEQEAKAKAEAEAKAKAEAEAKARAEAEAREKQRQADAAKQQQQAAKAAPAPKPKAPAPSYDQKIRALLSEYGCPNVPVKLDHPKMPGWANGAANWTTGEIYIRSGLTDRLRYVVAHECAHMRQSWVYDGDTSELAADMNAIYGGTGYEGLEQNADCVTHPALKDGACLPRLDWLSDQTE